MNIDALKRDLAAKKAQIETLSQKSRTLAEQENRALTDAEMAELTALIDEGKNLRARIDRLEGQQSQMAEIDRLTAGMTPPAPARGAAADPSARQYRSMGEMFAAEAGEFFRQGRHRNAGAWVSPSVEYRATLIDTTGGSGGPLIVPDYRPGLVDLRFQAPTIADLIAPGTTDSNAIIYFKETTFTNAAAAVAQGAAKPESALVYEQATDPVQKIAHFFAVTSEALEDIPAMRSMIDARGRYGLQLAEDNALLNGDGTAPNISGILDRAGLAAAQARGADSNADAILKEISKIETTSFVPVTGIVLNPANWQTIQLTKNAAGNYLGTGPWSAPQTPMLWGLPVVKTSKIAANLGLVGDFRGSAQIFRKGGVVVVATNSHSDWFVYNKTAVLFEERLALAVYRESAFGTVTGLA
jgi:HK97 family phage major capsid protein